MPSYGYRCGDCGPFEVRCSITERVPAARPCPRCASAARRVFHAPALRGMAPALRRALDADERSAHEPAVVTAPPRSARAGSVSTDPRHARLPRP